MGILVFVCPTTGHEVFNRRRNRQIQLQKTLEDEEGGLLSALSQEPYARRDEVPQAPDESRSTKPTASMVYP
jgi:hypothetical protein